IILDEGQNATVPQMKMFLTRMGQNARIVVTGDITQVDLPLGTKSGLADAVDRLRQVPGLATALLDRSDIVRHPLVQAIVDAYESSESTAEREGRPEIVPVEPLVPFPASHTAPEGGRCGAVLFHGLRLMIAMRPNRAIRTDRQAGA